MGSPHHRYLLSSLSLYFYFRDDSESFPDELQVSPHPPYFQLLSAFLHDPVPVAYRPFYPALGNTRFHELHQRIFQRVTRCNLLASARSDLYVKQISLGRPYREHQSVGSRDRHDGT